MACGEGCMRQLAYNKQQCAGSVSCLCMSLLTAGTPCSTQSNRSLFETQEQPDDIQIRIAVFAALTMILHGLAPLCSFEGLTGRRTSCQATHSSASNEPVLAAQRPAAGEHGGPAAAHPRTVLGFDGNAWLRRERGCWPACSSQVCLLLTAGQCGSQRVRLTGERVAGERVYGCAPYLLWAVSC